MSCFYKYSAPTGLRCSFIFPATNISHLRRCKIFRPYGTHHFGFDPHLQTFSPPRGCAVHLYLQLQIFRAYGACKQSLISLFRYFRFANLFRPYGTPNFLFNLRLQTFSPYGAGLEFADIVMNSDIPRLRVCGSSGRRLSIVPPFQ